MRERLRVVAGVQRVSFARQPPREWWSTAIVRTSSTATPVRAGITNVGPDYFGVFGVVPVAGREFQRREGRPVAIVNRRLAESLWPRSRTPIVYMRAIDAQLDSVIRPFRVVTMFLSLFGIKSLVIASVGQYAVVAVRYAPPIP